MSSPQGISDGFESSPHERKIKNRNPSILSSVLDARVCQENSGLRSQGEQCGSIRCLDTCSKQSSFVEGKEKMRPVPHAKKEKKMLKPRKVLVIGGFGENS
ncbi:hypothetical protein BaRGS_00031056 [Batillaria attramentaria]|uniref:Uncharacterized protein n=1 Tax=Batillaria attramentaria TaxID=370345 RepID=A0ABD0JS28_9CAEN